MLSRRIFKPTVFFVIPGFVSWQEGICLVSNSLHFHQMLRRFLFYETALNKQFWGFPVSAPGEERVAGATNVAVEAKKENAVEAHLSRILNGAIYSVDIFAICTAFHHDTVPLLRTSVKTPLLT